ncbi:protein SIEVE ELEMENT OCCLUSION B-like [Punica granatum]|uniref:Protein SIEVE ELEMENT OCCLUSION B-like n=1 Tax=Punica granatum TaxID=22663 RepID=A0A6P8CH03_PUNGR|nr:protein SIEVE ELEMENT OCCLUSION B-like [Punica granatum]
MKYPEKEVPELGAAYDRIPVWICLTIIAIVLVSAKFSSFTDFEERHWTWELSQLSNKVTNIASQVKQLVIKCQTQIEESKLNKKFEKNIKYPYDIVQLLMTLFKPFKPEDPSLLSGSTKGSVTFGYFRRKNVYLLISSWKIPETDLKALLNIYHDHKFQQKQPTEDGNIIIEGTTTPPPEKAHDILWVPALDWPSSHTGDVDELRAHMPWIVAKNASVVHQFALRYFREHWHFSREPILVFLNHAGWVECLNAMLMIHLWGIGSFPFTEQEIPCLLGSKTKAWIEMVIVPIIPELPNWMRQQNTVSLQPEIKERIADAIGTSFTTVGLDSLELVNQFLARLESRLYVKMQTLPLLHDGSVSDPMGDPEVHQMLQTFTAHGRGGFAILTWGYEVLTVALFTTAWKAQGEHGKWLQTVSKQTSTVHSDFEKIFI